LESALKQYSILSWTDIASHRMLQALRHQITFKDVNKAWARHYPKMACPL